MILGVICVRLVTVRFVLSMCEICVVCVLVGAGVDGWVFVCVVCCLCVGGVGVGGFVCFL